MEQYEDKSSQLLILINQLSDTRSKKVLQGFVQDLIKFEKSKIQQLDISSSVNSNSNSNSTNSTPILNKSNGRLNMITKSYSSSSEEDIEHLNINGSNDIIDQQQQQSDVQSSISVSDDQQQQLQIQQQISNTFFIDLCQDHINNTELSSQPSVLWKIVEYIISELDYIDRILDTHIEKKENTKLLSSTSLRLEEISYLLSFLQSSPKMHTGEYSELMLGINGHMKKITLKLKNCQEDNQYSNAKKYGWIEKRCGKNQSFSSWKRMWFILKDSKLTYYIKEKNLKKRSSTIASSQEFYKGQNGSSDCIIATTTTTTTNNNVNSNNNNNNNNSNNIIQQSQSQSQSIITDSVSHVNLEGELGKKKEGKGWKVRWMKLLDHTLLYFKSSKDREPLGIINLNECQDCEVNKESSNKFVVVHANNRYYFKTNTKEELIQWVKSVKSRIPSINQTDFKKMDLDQFQLKGVIEFSTILSVAETFKFNSQPNCLLITTDEKTYYLSFDSNKEKVDWLNQLNSNITKFNQSISVKGISLSSMNGSSSSNSNGKEHHGGFSNFKTSKPWRFSSSPSALREKNVKFTETSSSTNSLNFPSSSGSTSSSPKGKEEFEYGSQILPRKSTLIGPNGGVQVSSTSGAVELSPNLVSNNGGSSNNAASSSGNSSSNKPIPSSLNELIENSSDNEDGDDLKMMIPESLKNEMMRRSALSLLKTFKLEIFIGSNHQEVFTFLFSDSVLVDQVKAFAFKKIPSLINLCLLDFRLGIDEDTLLEVEFLKFIYSHTMVELALKTCGIVKIGVFHHRKDRRTKEKLYPEKYYQYLSQSPDGRKLNGMDISKSESNLNNFLNYSSSPSSSDGTSPNGSSNSCSNIQLPPLPTTQPIVSSTSTQPSLTPTPTAVVSTITTTSSLPNNSGSFIKTTPTTTRRESMLSSSPNLLSSSPSVNSSPIGGGGKVLPASWTSVNPSISLNQRRQLIQCCNGWNVEPNVNGTFTSVGYKPKFDKQEHGFYRRYNFDGQSTVQSFLGVDNKMGPIAFSLAKDGNDNYKGVLHTKHGAKTISEDAKNISGILNLLSISKKVKTKRVVSHLVAMLDPTIDSKLLNLASNQSELQKELLSFEERQTTSGFKFGMVYCRHGQVTDDEIFSNRSGSPEWDEFLTLIGDKIELVGWQHYSAGLDVKFNSTGTHSLYTDYHGNEVMFHVSTMLPFSTTDIQQIERKRQVGNDICVVVFNDGTLSYMPNTITSQFNHVVILVQYDKQNNGYKVSMACKDGVKTPFEPLSPLNLIKKSDIKDYIITKLINGELASLQAPVFASKITRTRESLLNYYISQFL